MAVPLSRNCVFRKCNSGALKIFPRTVTVSDRYVRVGANYDSYMAVGKYPSVACGLI